MSEGANLGGGMVEYSLCMLAFLGLGNKKILCGSCEIILCYILKCLKGQLAKLIRPKIKIAALFE